MVRKSAEVVVRPKRQVTLPKGICEQLGIGPGDVLEVSVEGAMIVARPRRVAALEALREIQRAFRDSGMSEEEVQKAGRRMRQEVARERYRARG